MPGITFSLMWHELLIAAQRISTDSRTNQFLIVNEITVQRTSASWAMNEIAGWSGKRSGLTLCMTHARNMLVLAGLWMSMTPLAHSLMAATIFGFPTFKACSMEQIVWLMRHAYAALTLFDFVGSIGLPHKVRRKIAR
eukprot:365228-Chlamydomonas_euryale.AAC.15